MQQGDTHAALDALVQHESAPCRHVTWMIHHHWNVPELTNIDVLNYLLVPEIVYKLFTQNYEATLSFQILNPE